MKKLDVPYFQTDKRNPGLTCIAMCLSFLKADRKPRYADLHWDEELREYAKDSKYPPNSPESLVKIVREYGRSDRFSFYLTIEQVEDHLDGGFPAIIHGYFTHSGHTVTIVGYERDGFLVHDPYGEWFRTGYRTDLSGAHLHYPYELIRELCILEGSFWVHLISH
ncbi:C39 family peptidase [Laspinema olomoucense]|uniref:C39 family peptidase n=1 Tax=Laspinema olomoucense TaxID=3231600 RepID=UPI0021BA4EC0|nr:C39 family peptidase [Laspinema sp. D3d]MCT7971086.1 C39 family peptidase [Laspinema sp. D3d]